MTKKTSIFAALVCLTHPLQTQCFVPLSYPSGRFGKLELNQQIPGIGEITEVRWNFEGFDEVDF